MAVHAPAGRGLSPLIPLGYFVCATAAFVIGALGTAWLAPELTGHYYHPHVVALTHTITLGWITTAIMGATYQLVPVVLQRPIWSARLARWQLAIVAVAVIGMIAHFYLGTWPGLVAGAALLATGVGLYLLNLAATLRGRGRAGSGLPIATPWTFTARLMTMGVAGLALTTLFGLALAANHLVPFLPGEFFPTLHAHVHLALLGWVTPMMLGVSARVYPMFLLAPEPGRWTSRLQIWGVAVGVPALVIGLLGVPGLARLGTLAMAAAALAHATWVLAMVRARKRPALDWGLRFTLTATAFLAPAIALGLAIAADALAGPHAALAYAVVVLGGWISLTIVGMMLRIVPFLVWYHVYGPRAGREPVPTLAALSAPRLEGASYALLTGGVGLLAVALLVGDATGIRLAGTVLSLGALAFAAVLVGILRHLAHAAARRTGAAL
ncbi:MAG TPA: hypothetical protein VID28_01475 [Methylomirabilota bacterium]|jgi:hypothetical protein